MAGKHLKRLAAPRAMHVHRKESKWTFKVTPGPHAFQRSVPLAVVVREFLGLCQTGREAKRIIAGGQILIDGKPVKNAKHPVGLMDVVSVPEIKQHHRVVLDHLGRVKLVAVAPEEAKWKLSRVENKTTIRGGKLQLNLHDGRNVLVPKDEYATGDALKLDMPTQKIVGVHKFQPGTLAFITGGAHVGQIAPIKAVEVKKGPYPNWVVLEGPGGSEFRTIKDYVFPVGAKKAEIKLPEVVEVGA